MAGVDDAPTLAELVATVRAEQDLSYREVAERSGGMLSHSTVHAIESGRPASEDALVGLALALELPLNEVRAAAEVPVPDTGQPFKMPVRAYGLNRKERRLILAMIDALLEAKKR